VLYIDELINKNLISKKFVLIRYYLYWNYI